MNQHEQRHDVGVHVREVRGKNS